ncbi:MAG: bacillithiol biosynthesis deacetylase BshB1 [Bacteroidia bacterium]|nr:bacillithiol biosynthesis deacetylase BshB1 [Bacteroidia bacterium]
MGQKLEILAIGAHPDDVEIGCGGTLVKHAELGYKTGIIDLSRGELGTRGSVEERNSEAEKGRKILKASVRENMNFRDGFFINDEKHQLALVEKIRKYKPEVVLCNAPDDRHPDHGRAASLVKDAVFLSGLRKIGEAEDAWRPRAVYHYIQAKYISPDIIVDISEHFDIKMEAIMAFKSQFYNKNSKEPQTYISDKSFTEMIKGRAVEFGKILGIKYGEGFVANRYIGTEDLLQIL